MCNSFAFLSIHNFRFALQQKQQEKGRWPCQKKEFTPTFYLSLSLISLSLLPLSLISLSLIFTFTSSAFTSFTFTSFTFTSFNFTCKQKVYTNLFPFSNQLQNLPVYHKNFHHYDFHHNNCHLHQNDYYESCLPSHISQRGWEISS